MMWRTNLGLCLMTQIRSDGHRPLVHQAGALPLLCGAARKAPAHLRWEVMAVRVVVGLRAAVCGAFFQRLKPPRDVGPDARILHLKALVVEEGRGHSLDVRHEDEVGERRRVATEDPRPWLRTQLRLEAREGCLELALLVHCRVRVAQPLFRRGARARE